MSSASVALVGLGYWGPNLARNFDDLAELSWLCDASPDALERYGARYPQARTTTNYDEVLADPELDAVVVATPAVTHYELAKRALEAGQARAGREASRDERWPKRRISSRPPSRPGSR